MGITDKCIQLVIEESMNGKIPAVIKEARQLMINYFDYVSFIIVGILISDSEMGLYPCQLNAIYRGHLDAIPCAAFCKKRLVHFKYEKAKLQ
jgi:hypothetical protein